MAPNRWEKTKSISKEGFDKAWDTVDKLGGPVNRLSHKLGAEAFWPMTIDKEADKAARILRSFCKDGFYAPDSSTGTDENGKINRPKGKQRVIQKIPTQVLKNAKGIAIFTTMRTGLWMSGSGGSGVLIGRLAETGEWSPPSGIMLHTAGIGFLAGVDIYDCVVIINTYEALDAFKKFRCTLGGEVSATAGPVGVGGVLESEVHKRQAPIWTYMKSKGLYAGVAVDGTIIIERTDENERFYGERISVDEILSGKVRHPPRELETLMQTLKAAQGDSDVDESFVPPSGETPGDLELTEDGQHIFGVPAADDPDPYGVKALEAEGLFIREAGTKARPSYETFEFRPNLDSPVYSTFSRRSMDSSPRNSWRASVQSSRSYASVDRGTQTDDTPLTEPTSVSRASSRSAKRSSLGRPPMDTWDEDEDTHWDTIAIHGDEEHVKVRQLEGEEAEDRRAKASACEDTHDDPEFEDDDEHFEIHEVGNATVTPRESVPASPTKVKDQTTNGDTKRTSPSFTRARLVTIPARTPPTLPPRHPRHVPGSGSSRASSSPTALSYSSTNTSPTDVTEAENLEHLDKSPKARPSPEMAKTTPDIPTTSEDEEFVDTKSEAPAEKDEFHSVNGESETEDNVITLGDHTGTETAEQESETDREGEKGVEPEQSPQLQKTPDVPKLAPNIEDTPEVEETLDKIEAKLEAEINQPEGQKSEKSYSQTDREVHDESPCGTKLDTTLPHARAE
jgi:lipid-binding SYLF domain-containing protein